MSSTNTIGQSSPMGATVCADGVNFSVFSKNATGMELLLFDGVTDSNPRVITLDPVKSWLDWTLLDRHSDVHRFVKQLIAIRLQPDPYRGYPENPTLNQIFARLEIKFHGVRLNQQGWGDDDHGLPVSVRDPEGDFFCHLSFNAFGESLEFKLPTLEEGEQQSWYRWLDTNLGTPDDITPWAEASRVSGSTYLVQSHSVVGLVARGPLNPQEIDSGNSA